MIYKTKENRSNVKYSISIVCSKNQDPPQRILQTVIDLYSNNQLKVAITKCNKTFTDFPNSVLLNNIKGAILQKQGNLDDAIHYYNKALMLAPDNFNAHNNLGGALQEQGRLSEAIESFQKSIEF